MISMNSAKSAATSGLAVSMAPVAITVALWLAGDATTPSGASAATGDDPAATTAMMPTGETGKIISIDYENDIAVAKVEISHPKSPKPYVDYFMLVKAQGRWIIVHKMFTKRK